MSLQKSRKNLRKIWRKNELKNNFKNNLELKLDIFYLETLKNELKRAKNHSKLQKEIHNRQGWKEYCR